ncbi:MAG TPA: efflux transporter outer membrane subunit [Limnobacter sp.]|uniref:efflux transporter outer membrane subunit n=1 Tax=Limnobacter sp. TaxID=2003368 RepID=UPI002ED91FFE
MRTRPRIRLIPVLLSLSLAACALPPAAGPLPDDTLPNWVTARNAKANAGAPAIEFHSDRWWTQVNDPALSALIEAALKDSAGARAAAARTAAAAAQLGIQKADELPTLGFRGEFNRQELSKNYYVPPQFGGRPLDIGQTTFNAGWNLDLWGQQRKAIEAALGELKATQAEQALVSLQLSTQIARAYVQLRYAKTEIDELQRMVDLQAQMVSLQQTRLDLGLDSGNGLDQARDAQAQTQQQLEQAKGLQARLLAALDSLVGDPNITQAALKDLQPGLPAPLLNYSSQQPIALSLLTRRPDLVGERFRVQAAAAEVDAQRLALLPNINLQAYLGTQAIGFNKLTQADSKVALLGGVVQFPIFDAGKIRFATEAKRAQFEAMKAHYESSITNAAQEVITEVLTLEQYKAEAAKLDDRSNSLKRIMDRAQQRRTLGLDSAMPAIESELAYRAQTLRSLELQLKSLGNQIDLVNALGGGFQMNNIQGEAS